MSESFGNWQILATFQSNIARCWLNRGNQSCDPFARFFFYFSGFNALFFLWGKVDGEGGGDKKKIHNLLKKFDTPMTTQILREVGPSVEFFQNRPPIQRMERRNLNRQDAGDEEDGAKALRDLLDNGRPDNQLLALGSMLYLVRSNLVHGSKEISGDDKKIIESSVPAIKVILQQSLKLTKNKFSPGN